MIYKKDKHIFQLIYKIKVSILMKLIDNNKQLHKKNNIKALKIFKQRQQQKPVEYQQLKQQELLADLKILIGHLKKRLRIKKANLALHMRLIERLRMQKIRVHKH
jgi:hypothetical protein